LSRTNGAAAINGKIYISGGCRDRKCFYPTNALYMYDPARDVWTQKREIPPDSSNGPDGENHYADGNGVSGVINGKLYVVSGCFENDSEKGYFESCSPLFFRYNPATDRWLQLPSPFAVPEYAPTIGGVIDGKFYVMTSNAVYFAVYDPATNRWTPLNALGGGPRYGAASAVVGGKLYVFGGWRYDTSTGARDTLATTVRYDAATRTWVQRADLPGPRTGIAASRIFLNGKARIEVVGGSGTGNNLQYTP
jgi:N-acetylneuraminic acid mutarotase